MAKKAAPPKAKKKPKKTASSGAPKGPRLRADYFTRFQPGQSGNPQGGKLHDPALKQIKNMTKDELKKVANLVIQGSMENLQLLARHEEATVLQKMLASVCLRVVVNGDMGALDTLLNRLVGKVKDEVEMSGDVKPQIIVTLPSNGREAKAS